MSTNKNFFDNSTFPLGEVVVTRSIDCQMENDPMFSLEVFDALKAYGRCDWGDTSPCDAELNDESIGDPETGKGAERILAVYKTSKGAIWIETVWDRSYTCVMFPEDY